MPTSKEPIAPADPDVSDELTAGDLADTLADAETQRLAISDQRRPSVDAHALRIVDCRVCDVDLSDADLARCSIRDVWERGSLANVRATEGRAVRAGFSGTRATGLNFAGTTVPPEKKVASVEATSP